MKKVVLLLLCMMAVSGKAVVIDNFDDGDISDYTATVILDANGGSSNTAVWQVNNGSLEIVTSAYDGIEQTAFIKDGYSLAIGEELQIDIIHNGASQDIGLYVGLAPEYNNRREFINVYSRSNTLVFSRGFSEVVSGEMNLKGGNISELAYDKLFIARDGATDYEAGYYNGSTRIVIADRNGLSFGADDDLVIGLYTDVRAIGTLASADNLAIVPEPATMALLGLGGVFAARKRKLS